MPTTTSFETSTTKRSTWSLQVVVTLAVFAAILVGMSGWTAWEYLNGDRAGWSEFMSHHLLPSLVIGFIAWGVITVLLGKIALQPIRLVSEHLYSIGSGRLEPLIIETRVEEIRTVVDGVNLLGRRLKDGAGDVSFTQAQERLEKIRKDMRSMVDAAGDDAEYLLETVRELRLLEAEILALSRKQGA